MADEVSAGAKSEGAHESFRLDVPEAGEVERVWREFWCPVLEEGGRLSVAKVKGELYDFYRLVDNARAVYRHVTGGVTDDLTVSAEGVVALAERRMERLRLRVQELERELEAVRAEA